MGLLPLKSRQNIYYYSKNISMIVEILLRSKLSFPSFVAETGVMEQLLRLHETR
jgi:hypothetical protein